MKERTRTEYSVMNILAGLGGYLLNTILGFVCRIVFARCLSADYLGVNGLFTNVLTMLSLAELGIGSAIVFALYKPLAEHDNNKVASLVQIYGQAYRAIGLVVTLVGLVLLPFLNVIIREQPQIQESIYLLYLINLFNTASTYLFSYRSSLLIAAQLNYLVSGISYAVTITQSVFQIVVLLLTHNYLAYLLIQTVGTFLYNIVVSKIAVKKFPFIKGKNAQPLSKEEKKKLFSNVRDLMIYKISSLLVNSTDNILITFFKGLSITGVASNYTLLVSTLNSFLGQIFNGLTASIGNHNAIEKNEERYKLFCFLNLMNFWIYGWAALGIVFCASDIVELCFGKNYVLPQVVPLVMSINFYTVGMMNAIWTYKHTMGLFHYGRFLQILTGILNIVFSVILGQKWGLVGIWSATVLARMMTNLWYDPYAVYVYGFQKSPLQYFKKYAYYLIVLLVAACVCKLAVILIEAPLIISVILKIVICSVLTNTVFFLAFHKTEEFKKLKQVSYNVLSLIFKRLKKDSI